MSRMWQKNDGSKITTEVLQFLIPKQLPFIILFLGCLLAILKIQTVKNGETYNFMCFSHDFSSMCMH